MILYPTKMENLPNSCLDCHCEWCSLPLQKRRNDVRLKKEYLSKRHKECPLIAIQNK